MAQILIVDDEPAIRSVLKLILTRLGHHVKETDTVHGAQTLIAEQTPDIVITDYLMPGGGGADLISWLKEVRLDPAVILMSGADLDTNATGFFIGADACLRKPFSPPSIERAISDVLAVGK